MEPTESPPGPHRHSLAELTDNEHPNDQAIQDARDLADLGHEQLLSRKFTTWSMFFLAFSVLGTWSTFAQGLSSGLTSGGPITILWGLVLVAVCNVCVAVSLGELCSSMPTALGQAYWISRVWPGNPWARFASYMCAWVNTFGWWALSASQLAFMTNFILSMKVLFIGEWEPATTGWINFLLYLGVTLFVTLINLVACRRDFILPMFNNFVGVCFITLFFVFQSTIEFRGVPFMWLPDLSQPDPYYILPLLLGVSMFGLQWLGLRATPTPNPQMKILMWILPVFMVVIFANLASGLNLYYTATNLATIPQQLQLSRERRRAQLKLAGAESAR
jgi:hypothetical protein